VIRAELSRRFRALLSGAESGVPEWTPLIAAGDDPGLFEPGDAPWVVHSDLATMIGGIRALLVQAMHPGSLAGVAQHSRYEEDVLGRLSGTIRWLTIMTYGPKSAITNEAGRVNGMHTKVRGTYNAPGETEPRSYKASDPDLLMWVHIAFTDSFLAAHLAYGEKPIPGGADLYVKQWGRAVLPLGVDTPPASLAELESTIDSYRDVITVNERTLRIVKFLRWPPLPKPALPIYALLFAAAVGTLPEDWRKQLGLRTLPNWFVRPVTRSLLWVMRLIVGDKSPLEDAALSRLERIKQKGQSA
jgi:uncharacterized protein (DUF2236 family)